MLKFLFKKITRKKEEKKPNKAEELADSVGQNSKKLFDIISNKFDEFIEEIGVIREKSKDLEGR